MTVDDEVVGAIGEGVVVLLGVSVDDTPADAQSVASKVAHLRIFREGEVPLNRSLLDVAGRALVVSQFTLLADVRKGRRPSLSKAAPGPDAEPLVDLFVKELRTLGVPVETGRFGANMVVSLSNDGPVTIVVESEAGRVV